MVSQDRAMSLLLFILLRLALRCAGSPSLCMGFSWQGLLLLQRWSLGHVVFTGGLWSTDPGVVVLGLSWPAACGIFPDEAWNLCPLH